MTPIRYQAELHGCEPGQLHIKSLDSSFTCYFVVENSPMNLAVNVNVKYRLYNQDKTIFLIRNFFSDFARPTWNISNTPCEKYLLKNLKNTTNYLEKRMQPLQDKFITLPTSIIQNLLDKVTQTDACRDMHSRCFQSSLSSPRSLTLSLLVQVLCCGMGCHYFEPCLTVFC